jgi:hypothetical protein
MKSLADILIRFGAISATLLALAANLAWGDTVANKAGQFSVNFPGPVKESTQNVDTSAGTATAHILSYRSREAIYTALYSDYPAGAVGKAPVDVVYAGAINGAVQKAGGTLRSSTPIQVGNITGREAVLDAPSKAETVRVRYFLVGDRLYQVMYDGPTGTEKSPQAMSFLDSFQITTR